MADRKPTEAWMTDLEPDLRQIAEELRRVVRDAGPELGESIKWGNPVYERKGLVCYLAATKGYVSLGFFNGAALNDPQGIMEGTGKKMRHVKVRDINDISGHQLATWVREAVRLNEKP